MKATAIASAIIMAIPVLALVAIFLYAVLAGLEVIR